MLTNLYLKDFILIEELDLDFKKGFTVFTGETGAGKSIILDSITLSLGKRITKDYIRNGCTKSTIVTNHKIDNNPGIQEFLKENEIDFEDNQISLKRIILKDRKSKSFINDIPFSNNIISQISSKLIEVHGQHESKTLLDPKNHIKILDQYHANKTIIEKTKETFTTWENTKKQLEEIKESASKLKEESDYLKACVKELEILKPEGDELNKLIQAKQTLKTKKQNHEQLKNIHNSQQQNTQFKQEIIKQQNYFINKDENNNFKIIEETYEQLLTSLDQVEDLILEELNNSNFNNEEFENIEERISQLSSAARKFQIEANLLPELLKKSKAELNKINNLDSEINKLEISEKNAAANYKSNAEKLSKIRRDAAITLENKVLDILSQLKMARSRFNINFEKKQNNFLGFDDIIFNVSFNPGTKPQSLHKVSSGGELSRFMLAIKSLLHNNNKSNSIIFDEIDTGIGADIAKLLAIKLKELSEENQVILITHQAQIAVKADTHCKITKKQSRNNTTSTIEILQGNNLKNELTRMMTGSIQE
jgi:DNA repair protein RecN (Recombination protein N)